MSKIVIWGKSAKKETVNVSSTIVVKEKDKNLSSTIIHSQSLPNVEIEYDNISSFDPDRITSINTSTLNWEDDRMIINNDLNSIDIIEIHCFLRTKIQRRSEQLINQTKILNNRYANAKTKIQQRNIELELNDLSLRKKENQLLKDKYKDYCDEVKTLLSKYNKILPDKTVIFGKANVQYNQDKINGVKEYLSILSKILSYDIIQRNKPDNICLSCYSVICPLPVSPGVIVCPHCNEEKIIYTSSDTRNKIIDNGYEDIVNFSKTLSRYQGKQKLKFGERLYTKLDNYFKSIKKPIGEDIKKLPLLPTGKKEGTSYDILYQALADTGNSGHYEDSNLIAHNYWGWKLPEIAPGLEKLILDHYALTQKIFSNMSVELRGRKSSLNTQYRLFKHLELVGFRCSINDFKIPDTEDVVEGYDETWYNMVKEANLVFYPTK
jgi:hypothetical protein